LNPSRPFASQGFSAFSEPCHFDEDQFLVNVDYVVSDRNRVAARFLQADDNENVTFPGNGLNTAGNIAGFRGPSDSEFTLLSVADTYMMAKNWLNEARFGYFRNRTSTDSSAPFKWSDVGVAESDTNRENELPSLNVLGSVSMASSFPREFTQNSFVFTDDVSSLQGAHALRFGGSVTRLQVDATVAGVGSFLQFLSWPDFLLGLSGQDNGTGGFSNVFGSVDLFGLFTRQNRVWEGSAYAQDDYKVFPTLTLNLGLRYERLGQFSDELGRNSTFNIKDADPNPPASGSLAGYIVASSFPGTPPPGVRRASNTLATEGAGQNGIAPRIGFAWNVSPSMGQLILRGGYGIFYSRPTGQAFTQMTSGRSIRRAAIEHGSGKRRCVIPNAVRATVSDGGLLSHVHSVRCRSKIKRQYPRPRYSPGFHSAVLVESSG
jgi:hypothetical protein